MPRIGVSITKQTAYRGATQEFSNVYYYEMLSTPDAAAADNIIDNLTTLEKTFHGSPVTFVRGRVWTAGGGPTSNNMISQKLLTGAGGASVASYMDRERAYLFRLRAGNDSRGNPVYLRKWYHSCGPFTLAVTPTQTIFEQVAAFSTAQRNAGVAAMQAIGDANGSAGTPKLCSKVGRLPDAGAQW